MPPKPWKTLSSRLIYENPWIKVREDIAELPDSRTTLYGVVEVGQAVGISLSWIMTGFVLVRQYRYVFGENQRWEMPTGGVIVEKVCLMQLKGSCKRRWVIRLGSCIS
jgi:ADP-ribose pyrophosphatase